VNMEYELSMLDRHFASFICSESNGAPPSLKLVVSLASNAVGTGNICLNLADIAGRAIRIDGEEFTVPAFEELRNSLLKTAVVGSPGDYRPLVLDGEGRLYLYRYWKYERDLARVILEKAATPCTVTNSALLGAGLSRMFPGTTEGETDWQMVAALVAVRKSFCVISGGPGTGKTSTVVKILALLLEQSGGELFRIALAAPTGKAAARLKESVGRMKAELDCAAAVKEQIPAEVSTIHRLLGSIAGSVHFRYCAENPLPYDAVIVDEASMVALPLMAKLAAALKPNTRLILLGDRDQLASVEAGAVLGDICGGERVAPVSAEFAAIFAGLAGVGMTATPVGGPVPPLSDALVMLKKNYRFRDDSGIGAVGQAVNAGNGAEAIALLKSAAVSGVVWHGVPTPDGLKKALTETVVSGYGAYLAAGTAAEALARFDAFRVLCALRQGPYGVTGINALVEEILAGKGLIDPRNRWYRGRPVLITVNDYNLKLFNGDVGIVFSDSEGNPRVWFPADDGGVRKVSPLRLPVHETVFAMTIHKSQGSEFNRVLMLLPDHDSLALTRELIYTGITRAKREVAVWGDEEVFVTAVSRRINRKSGLREALWREA
jgi:exodeoxyribonuclease V alpha subunit